MEVKNNLFEEFSDVSREEWAAVAEKELRGRPLDDLKWHLGEDVDIAPFYHPDDMGELPAPILSGRRENRWEIGELVDVLDIARDNEALLEGLEGGVEAPLLILPRNLTDDELERLFENVRLDYISTHFTQLFAGKKPQALLRQFHLLLRKWNYDPEIIKGSIDFDPILDWSRPPFAELAEAIHFCEEKMPNFRMLQVNGLRFHSGPENTSLELALIAAKASEYLAQLLEQGISAARADRQMQFTLALSTSFFVEIAKIRALRILWANILKAHGATQSAAIIVAHLAQETQGEDVNTNMIKAGTQAMSAVIGGAERLYVRPADFSPKQSGTPFTKRIARNTQHLLRLESHLGWVLDPAAGSYYLEKLTEKLAQSAWHTFQELDARKEFG